MLCGSQSMRWKNRDYYKVGLALTVSTIVDHDNDHILVHGKRAAIVVSQRSCTKSKIALCRSAVIRLIV
jgi:hypothetical protein